MRPYVVIIASFVTVIDLLLQAYLPSLSKSLGLYIPLIVVNCIILARAEAFASKNSVLPSLIDGLSMGVGFTLALSAIAVVREILGNGTLYGIPLFGANFTPCSHYGHGAGRLPHAGTSHCARAKATPA